MIKNSKTEITVILTGTDPSSRKGGIGVVLPAYIHAIENCGYQTKCITSYVPGSISGKIWPWMTAFIKLYTEITKAKHTGKKVIVYSHSGDGISIFRESLLQFFSRFLGANTVIQLHSAKIEDYLNNEIYRRAMVRLLKPSEIVCMLTPWWKKRLEDNEIHNKIDVIPNPLPRELRLVASADRVYAEDKKKILILTMARLVSGKGVDVVIRAMDRLREDFCLIVAGDGKQREMLEKLSRDMDLGETISFTGWVSGEEKTKLLKQADIFCLPSTYDVFPISMVEAMAFGLPVVGVKWGGIPDIVAHGRVGFLVDEPCPELIADALKELSSSKKRIEMGREAKKWVLMISDSKYVENKIEAITNVLLKHE